MMDRLTERDAYWLGEEFWLTAREPDDEEIESVYERLKHYEDLEEAGRLIERPCDVGDEVYIITKCGNIPQKLDGSWETATGYYCPYELNDGCPHDTDDCTKCNSVDAVFKDYIRDFLIDDHGIGLTSEICDLWCIIGENAFFTREEAEAALKERETE